MSNDGQRLSVEAIFHFSEGFVQQYLTRISAPQTVWIFRRSKHGKRESDFFGDISPIAGASRLPISSGNDFGTAFAQLPTATLGDLESTGKSTQPSDQP
jgi:hypothetical protein